MMKHEITESIWTRIARLRQNDIDLLAPKFQTAINETLKELAGRAILIGSLSIPLDVIVFETLRKNELQEIYFVQGTSNAKTAIHSWHYYGLAIDVISKQYEWFGNAAAKKKWPIERERLAAADKWFRAVAGFFKANHCAAGADWRRPDLPHIQWLDCESSPTQSTIDLMNVKGMGAVWEKYRAT